MIRRLGLPALALLAAFGAGAPALGVRVTIDDEGEVLTASNHNLDGYWEQPDATADAQAGGWFHTGDGGILDKDGYLVIFEKDFKRNFVHVRDVADCVLHVLKNPSAMVGKVFNLGLDSANLSKEELALRVKEYVPNFYVHFAPIGQDPDKRNYIVSSDRLRRAGFEARRSLDAGIRDQFGYKHLLWVYSGRRGIHLWISDKEAMELTDEQRRALVNWMTVIQGGKETHKKVNVRLSMKPLPPPIQYVYRSFSSVLDAAHLNPQEMLW